MNKAQVLVISSSNEELQELDISLEDLTSQNENGDLKTEHTDEFESTSNHVE